MTDREDAEVGWINGAMRLPSDDHTVLADPDPDPERDADEHADPGSAEFEDVDES